MNVKAKKIISKSLSAVSIVLIVLLSLVLIGNVIFIVKGADESETPPSILGVTPLVVTSGSMDGDKENSFPAGSMIFIKASDGIAVGDVVTFFDPASKTGKSIVTHRIAERIEENGIVKYKTKGDDNNNADDLPITEDMVIGEYFFHIPALGSFTLFLKEPLGMLLCIGLPILAFVTYDVIKKQVLEKRSAGKNAEMEAELERLRAMVGETEKEDAENATEETSD